MHCKNKQNFLKFNCFFMKTMKNEPFLLIGERKMVQFAHYFVNLQTDKFCFYGKRKVAIYIK